MVLTRADREWIESRALGAGFDCAGIADLPDLSLAAEDDRRFTQWIDAGYAGEMEYLKRADEDGAYLHGDLRRSMPWARSVIVCAVNYNAEAPRSIDPAPPTRGWIARYAWSGQEDSASASDYHDVLLARLLRLEAEVKLRFGNDSAAQETTTRCYVDTGPLVERSFAVRAGVGWIGKNTCVIDQQQGSWLLLGVIVTSFDLAPDAWSLPAADRCGTCTRCIDACPTDALSTPAPDAPRIMDATRCIAYLTIEKKGRIEPELRPLIGRQVFGCDICQDVCPWNRKAPVAASGMLPPRDELVNPSLQWLAGMDGPAFNRMFRGSPLERTRRKRVLRNVAIAMGNSGEQQYLPQLDAWAAAADEVLADAAAWAADRLRNSMGNRRP